MKAARRSLERMSLNLFRPPNQTTAESEMLGAERKTMTKTPSAAETIKKQFDWLEKAMENAVTPRETPRGETTPRREMSEAQTASVVARLADSFEVQRAAQEIELEQQDRPLPRMGAKAVLVLTILLSVVAAWYARGVVDARRAAAEREAEMARAAFFATEKAAALTGGAWLGRSSYAVTSAVLGTSVAMLVTLKTLILPFVSGAQGDAHLDAEATTWVRERALATPRLVRV